MRYDSIIVGTGPAGFEAALNLKIRNKTLLLFGTEKVSTKVTAAPKISNYLGLSDISGKEIAKLFLDQLSKMDITVTEEKVTAIFNVGDFFSVSTNKDVYEATTIILSPGIHTAKAYPGENEFLGRGVGFCATCDAPLYRGKKVVIIGDSLDAQQEANFTAEIASEVIYVPIKQVPTILNDSIKVVVGSVVELQGESTASRLVLDTTTIEADGFFVLRESIAPSSLVPGLLVDGAHIKVDADMNTNIAGVFAAGDCTGRPYQYMRAAGQGLTAAHSAVKYLSNIN